MRLQQSVYVALVIGKANALGPWGQAGAWACPIPTHPTWSPLHIYDSFSNPHFTGTLKI